MVSSPVWLETNVITRMAANYPPAARNSVALEVLHRALMLLRRGARLEGAQIAALAGLGIGLARVQAIFARCELADHGNLLRGERAGALCRCGGSRHTTRAARSLATWSAVMPRTDERTRSVSSP